MIWSAWWMPHAVLVVFVSMLVLSAWQRNLQACGGWATAACVQMKIVLGRGKSP